MTFYQDNDKKLWTDADVQFPPEFNDTMKVLLFGAKKYAPNEWLTDGKVNHKDNCASMFRHLAKYTAGETTDSESGLDHLLHLACRALMGYTIEKRERHD